MSSRANKIYSDDAKKIQNCLFFSPGKITRDLQLIARKLHYGPANIDIFINEDKK